MERFPPERIFNIRSEQEFNGLCLEIFHYQARNNVLYRNYIKSLRRDVGRVQHPSQIPFLPIGFFRSFTVVSGDIPSSAILFESSGTTGMERSRHVVTVPDYYDRSLAAGFRFFYGPPEKYILIALLPSYVERKNSSLVYMADKLIRATHHPDSGFYPADAGGLSRLLDVRDRKVLLLGVTFALLDLAETLRLDNPRLIVMETGGMKGRRKELVREEVHTILSNSFPASEIHSEYGMTELLSQAYSQGRGIFRTPPWMKVLIRDPNDPLSLTGHEKTGGINVIDLANVHSCAFISTQDLGRTHHDGSFEVLGRFDHSDLRGCNLLVE